MDFNATKTSRSSVKISSLMMYIIGLKHTQLWNNTGNEKLVLVDEFIMIIWCSKLDTTRNNKNITWFVE